MVVYRKKTDARSAEVLKPEEMFYGRIAWASTLGGGERQAVICLGPGRGAVTPTEFQKIQAVSADSRRRAYANGSLARKRRSRRGKDRRGFTFSSSMYGGYDQ